MRVTCVPVGAGMAPGGMVAQRSHVGSVAQPFNRPGNAMAMDASHHRFTLFLCIMGRSYDLHLLHALRFEWVELGIRICISSSSLAAARRCSFIARAWCWCRISITMWTDNKNVLASTIASHSFNVRARSSAIIGSPSAFKESTQIELNITRFKHI